MKKTTYLILAALFLCQTLFSQIQVDNTTAPESAVNDVLLGTGVDAFNITFSGDANQIGTFFSNGSSVPINSGVILGTGNVNLASASFDDTPGPGGNLGGGSTSGGGNFGANDDDLEAVSGQDLNDAAILEFDFTATGDSISFNFLFASEEYLEWVNSGFNDAFGFFLSGPGISGGMGFDNDAINLAIVPDTNTPITINSVNDVDNSEYYINNPETVDPDFIEFDGFTTVLSANTTSELLCDSTYHIKMVIADGGDTAFDSAVFLEAGSFSSNAVDVIGTGSIAGTSVFAGDSIVVEGPNCNLAGVNFILPDTTVVDTVIYFNISGTAINGIDYTSIPDSVIILAGEIENSISFNAIEDNLEEEIESVMFSYEYVTICGDTLSSESTIYIADYVEPTVSIEDVEAICPNTPTPFTAETTGFGGFSYEWNVVPDNSGIIQYSPQESDTVVVVATDICGEQVTDTAFITIPDYPEIEITFDPETLPVIDCPGDPISVTANATGGAGDFTYFWTEQFIFGATLNDNPFQSTTYTVTATDVCSQVATESISVTVTPWPGLDITALPVEESNCEGAPVDIGVEVSGGISSNYTYNWFPEGGNTAETTVFPVEDTQYTVTVSDGCGTEDFTVQTEVNWPGLTIEELPSLPSNCPGDLVEIGVMVSGGVNPDGGTPEYTYTWENGENTPTTEVFPQVTSDFDVVVSDGCGSESFQVTATVNLPIQDISATYEDSLCISTTEDFIDLIGGNGNYYFNIYEFPTDSLTPNAITITDVNGNVSYIGNQEGFYTIEILDECDWVNPFQAVVQIVNCDTFIPNVFSPDNDNNNGGLGYNETFQIIGLEGFPNSSLIIYNRWGTIVYEDNNYNNNQGWDGKTAAGNEVSAGVYFYKFTRSDGKEQNGTITLLREE